MKQPGTSSQERKTWRLGSISEGEKEKYGHILPIALPTTQEVEVEATSVQVFVMLAAFREIMEKIGFCVDQKESVTW